MYKKMRIVLGVISCVMCFFSLCQAAFAAGYVEQITIDVEKGYFGDDLRTVSVQDSVKAELILLAKNCSDVCGPSPTRDCNRWGKNHCCECCEPLPRHCDKRGKWWKCKDKDIRKNRIDRKADKDVREDKTEKEDNKKDYR